jgi:hypothetical protein
VQKHAQKPPSKICSVSRALSAIKDILDYKRFCNLPLGLVLEYKNVLIYNRLVNGCRLN